MRTILVVLAVCLLHSAALAADIASVNFNAIKDDLRAYYLSKPENAERKKAFEAAVAAESNRMEEIQKKIKGNQALDIVSMMPDGTSRYELDAEDQR